MNLFRFEDKFVCTQSEIQLIKAKISSFGEIYKEEIYQVNSLYYDTLNGDSYRTKLDGEYLKTKLRARHYNEDFSHFEIKEKKGLQNRKTKIDLSSDQYMNIINQKDLRNFFKEILIPSVWVRYKREAYQLMINDKDIRVTIDSNIEFTKHISPHSVKFSDSVFIVEFKYSNRDERMDLLYAHLMLKRPVSFSKFFEGAKCFS